MTSWIHPGWGAPARRWRAWREARALQRELDDAAEQAEHDAIYGELEGARPGTVIEVPGNFNLARLHRAPAMSPRDYGRPPWAPRDARYLSRDDVDRKIVTLPDGSRLTEAEFQTRLADHSGRLYGRDPEALLQDDDG